MDWLFSVLLGVHVLVAIGVVGLVLVQHGKGADMGAAFGSGASGSLFGATGSANVLSRTTAALATVFFLTSLGLSYVATNGPKKTSVMESTAVPASTSVTTPAAAPAAPSAVPGEVQKNQNIQEIPK